MSAALQWSARAVPAHRKALADDLESSAARLSSLSDHFPPGFNRDADQARASAHSHVVWAQQARSAQLFWVTEAMASLALDASLDVPAFSAGDLICPNGITLFQAPLPPLAMPTLMLSTGQPWTGEVPVWGLWWHRSGDRLGVEVLTRTGDLPRPMLRGSGQLQPVIEVPQSLEHPTVFAEVGGAAFRDTGETMSTAVLGVLALVSAMSHLMQVPTLAQRRPLDGRTGGTPKPTGRPADVVTTVDLRPLRYEATDATDAASRAYTHRWVVRGHWAMQPYGPRHSLRKLIYREPYVKGPEGAPFLLTEKVAVWRR